MRNICYWLCVGHVVEFVVYFMASKMKSSNMENHAAIVRVLSSFLAYLVPIFYSNYLYIKYKEISDRRDTVYANWMFQEIYVFHTYIISGMVCLLTAFVFKYRAPRRERKIRKSGDPWLVKDNDDFLNYMKMEFRQFCLHFPNIFREAQYILRGWLGGDQGAIHIQLLFAMPLAYRIFACSLFFVQLSRGWTIKQGMMNIIFWAIRVCLLIGTLVYFIFVRGDLRQTQISQMLLDIVQLMILLPYDWVIQKQIEEELEDSKKDEDEVQEGYAELKPSQEEEIAEDEKKAANNAAKMIEKIASSSNLEIEVPQKQDLGLLDDGEAVKKEPGKIDFASAATKGMLLKALAPTLGQQSRDALKEDAIKDVDIGMERKRTELDDILERAREVPQSGDDFMTNDGEAVNNDAIAKKMHGNLLQLIKAGLPAKEAGEKRDIADKMEIKNVISKITVSFDADIYSLTALCFWRDHVENFRISKQVLAQRVYMMLFIFLVQFLMIFCMTVNLFRDDSEFTWGADAYWYVFFARFTCAVALHIKITPIARKGIKLFNFCNNQAEHFTNESIPVACGLLQVITSYAAVILNATMLIGRKTVEKCIIDFVALVIVVDITQLYFAVMSSGSQGGLDFKNFISTPVIKRNMSSELNFSDRSCCQKIYRVLYKVHRAVFVSVFFYFMPFAVIVLPFFVLRWPFSRIFEDRSAVFFDDEAKPAEKCITGNLPFAFWQFKEFVVNGKTPYMNLCKGNSTL